MELICKNIYIFTQRNTNYPTPFKGKILELTKTTIYIENLDLDTRWRSTLEKFNNDLKPIELIHDFYEDIENTIRNMTKQPLEFKKFKPNPFTDKIFRYPIYEESFNR